MESFLKQYCSKEWQEFVSFHKKQITVNANDFIFKEGDPTEGLYIVNKGRVKVVSKDLEEKEVLIRLASDGDILGHRGFGGDWTYPISAITFEKTQISFIPIDVFNTLAKANTEFTYQLMMFFAEELRRSEEKILQLPVKNRVAKAIWMNQKVFGFDKDEPNKLSFTLSRKDFASKSLTTYESVIRVLSDLNKEKVIKIVGKSIYIDDLDKLKAISFPPTL